MVKLDRALIRGIDGDPSRQRLVGALIDYAHELDVRVVAEGVETEEELAVVGDLGADLGQGWYLGRAAAEPVRVQRSLVMDAKAGHVHGTTLELRDRALASATSGVVISDAVQEGMPSSTPTRHSNDSPATAPPTSRVAAANSCRAMRPTPAREPRYLGGRPKQQLRRGADV